MNENRVSGIEAGLLIYLGVHGNDGLGDVAYICDKIVGLRVFEDSTGKMNANGLALLKKMEELNIILDATHLCDDAFWQAMDKFNGAIWASHNNCRALVNHNRQFNDEQIKELIKRGAIIGGALDAWMMVPNWVRCQSDPRQMNCNLEKIIDHFDHICQIAGNTLHIGIGSDLDGAFGKEQSPYDLETIAGLQTLPSLLNKRGYKNEKASFK